MGRFSRAEIEDAFQNFQQTALAAGTSGDWNAWADLFTEDATYVEHGIVVVPVTPSSIARRPEEVLERIRTVVRQNLGRDLSRIHVRQREIGA